jgi:hypothetical protein
MENNIKSDDNHDDKSDDNHDDKSDDKRHDKSDDKSDDSVNINKIVITMANMLNYLNVSLYEGQFTYKHEQARAKINEIYDSVSKTPLLAPSLDVTTEFYNNVKCLKNVTDTDDPEYYQYMRELRNYYMMVL